MEQRERRRFENFDILGNYLTIFYIYTIMLVILIFLSLTSNSHANSVAIGPENNELKTVNDSHNYNHDSELLLSQLSREAYRNFSVDLLREFLNVKKLTESEVGVDGLSPWSVAHMLSVIKENIWVVPTTGFDHVLHLKPDKIRESYKEIIGHLSEDSHLHMHSNVYTSTKGIATPENIEQLKTRVSYINYDDPNTNEAITKINDIIAGQTFGKIHDRLIPLGGWYGAPLYNYTQGVFINTFHYSSEWVYPFFSVGMKRFGAGESRFLEAVGDFNLYRHRSYTAVRIPLKHKGKSLVLIKPKQNVGKTIQNFVDEHFGEFLQEMEQTQENPQNSRQIKIQVPAFNFSQFNSFSEPLAHLGITESICMYKPEFINTIEAFAQSFYGHVAEDKFEVASATGSNLNNVDHFFKSHHEGSDDHEVDEDIIGTTLEPGAEQLDSDSTDYPPPQIAQDETKISGENEHKLISSASSNSTATLTDEYATADPATLVPVVVVDGNISTSNNNGSKDKDIALVFDTPFLWYFQDHNLGLGPLLLGTVETAPKSSEEVVEPPPPGFEWLVEAQKFIFWSCPDGAILSHFSDTTKTADMDIDDDDMVDIDDIFPDLDS